MTVDIQDLIDELGPPEKQPGYCSPKEKQAKWAREDAAYAIRAFKRITRARRMIAGDLIGYCPKKEYLEVKEALERAINSLEKSGQESGKLHSYVLAVTHALERTP